MKTKTIIQILHKACCVALCFLLTFTPSVFAIPQIDQVVNGTVSTDLNGNALTINATDNTIINYSSFDIGAHESVTINLPSSSSQILNRVLGSNASQILGNLSSNGLVILVNPNGVFIGTNSNITASSLIISTRDIGNEDFLNKNYTFEKLDEGQTDRLIQNLGNINITEGGFGVLIAGGIHNGGKIIAPAGKIALAAGDAVRLDIADGGLLSIAILEETADTIYDHAGNPITDQIKNTGEINAAGGMVIMDAQSITDLFRHAINIEGKVEATSMTAGVNGVIELRANDNIYSTGYLQANEIDIQTSGEISTLGSLIADRLVEAGATFGIGGVFSVGQSHHDNEDQAITYLFNTALTGTITDVENIIINENVQVTINTGATFTADSDSNGTGAFIMKSGSSIVGAGGFENLTINTSGSSVLRDISGIWNLTVNSTASDSDITVAGDITAGIINLYAKDDLIFDTAAAGGDITITNNNFERNMNLKADFDESGAGSLTRVGSDDIILDLNMENVLTLQSATDFSTSTLLGGALANLIDPYDVNLITTGEADITVDSSLDYSLTSYYLALHSGGDLIFDTTGGARSLKIAGSGTISLKADNNSNGSGTLSKVGANSISLNNANTINMQSAADWSTSSLLGGILATEGFRNLYAYTTGEADITVDSSFDLSSAGGGQLNFYSGGDLFIDTTGGARTIRTGTGGTINLKADNNSSGSGSLSKTGANSLTLNASSTGNLYLQSASDWATSSLLGGALAGATYGYLHAYTTGEADITIDTSHDLSAVANTSLNFYSGGDLIIDTTGGARTIRTGTGGTINLKADNNSSGSGALSKVGANSITLNASNTGNLYLQSAADWATSSLLGGAIAGATYRGLHAYTKGEADITVDTSIDLSAIASSQLNFYSNGDLIVDATGGARTLRTGTTGTINLKADNNTSGSGALSKAGANTITLNASATNGTINLQSASNWATSTFLGAATLKTLNATTTGEADITVDSSLDLSAIAGSQLNFMSDGDLIIDATAGAINLKSGSAGRVYLYADYDGDGGGTLSKSGANAITLNATNTGTLVLQSASDVATSSLLGGAIAGATYRTFHLNTTGENDLTIDTSIDLSAIASSQLNFYSNGDLTIDTTGGARTIRTGTGGTINLKADYNASGSGALTKAGANALTLNASTTGTTNLQSASDWATSTFLGALTTRTLNAYTTGEGDITIDSSHDLSAIASSQLNFYSNGDLIIDTTGGARTIRTGTGGTINLKADNNSSSSGALTKAGANGITINASTTGTTNLQSASDWATSTFLGALTTRTLNAYTTGEGDITIDSSHDLSAIASSQLNFYSNGDLIFDSTGGARNLKIGTNGTINMYADYDNDTLGTLQRSGGNSFTLTGNTGGTLNMQGNAATFLMPILSTFNNTATVRLYGNSADTIYQLGGAPTIANLWIFNNAALDLNGNNLTVGTALNNNGTIRLQGTETLTGTLDTNSGSVAYYGSGAYNSLSLGNTYNSLEFAGSGSWKAAGAVDVNNLLTITSGTFDLNGNSLDLTGVSAFSNLGTLKMNGDETLTNFTNDTDSGTVKYAGTGAYAQLIAGDNYYNLAFDGSGTWDLDAALDVNNDFTITNGTVEANAYAMTIGGNWSNAGTFTHGNNTVTFDKAGNQTVNAGASAFKNIVKAGTGTLQATTNDMNVAGSLAINSGNTYDLNGRGLTLNTLVNNGTMVLGGGETVAITTMDTDSGLVKYTGAGSYAQLAAGDNYYNLTFDGSGSWTLDAALDVNNNLAITTGTLIANAMGMTVGGNWTNAGTFTHGNNTVTFDGTGSVTAGGSSFYNTNFNGTSTLASAIDVDNHLVINNSLNAAGYGLTVGKNFTNAGTFTHGNNTVTFDGTGNINAGASSLYNANFNGTSTLASAIDVDNHLAINGSLAAAGYGMTVGKDFTNAGTFTHGNNTVTFDGIGNINAGANSLYNVNFNGTSTLTGAIDVDNHLAINGSLSAAGYGMTVGKNFTNAGTFTHGNNTMTFDGTGNINTGGVSLYNANFNGASTLAAALDVDNHLAINGSLGAVGYAMAVGKNFTNAGTFTHGNNTVTFDGIGNINTGASSLYNTNFNGTSTLAGALDVDNHLSINGSLSAAGYGMTVGKNFTNAGTFTHGNNTMIFDGTGNINTGGVSLYNANFNGASTLASAIDVDNHLAINGSLAAAGYGMTVGKNFTAPGTFIHGNNTVTFDGTGNINMGANSLYNANFNGTSTLAGALDVDNDLSINGSLNAAGYAMTVGDDWSNAGTFTHGNNTVTFDGAGVQLLDNGASSFKNVIMSGSGTLQLQTNPLLMGGTFLLSSGTFDVNNLASTVTGLATLSGGIYLAKTGTQTFGGLTINGGTMTGAGGDIDVNGNMLLSSGTFTTPTGNLTVAGNWTKTGGTLAGDKKVTFDGAGAHTMTSGGDEYNQLAFNNAAGSWTLQDDLDVKDVVITNGELNDGGRTINVEGNWTNQGTLTATGKVVLDGNLQTVNGDNTFKNLTKRGAGMISFEAGKQQNVTGTLILDAMGSVLGIKSTVNGVAWKLNPTGPVQHGMLTIKDSLKMGAQADCIGCTNLGGNTNWRFELPLTVRDVRLDKVAVMQVQPAPVNSNNKQVMKEQPLDYRMPLNLNDLQINQFLNMNPDFVNTGTILNVPMGAPPNSPLSTPKGAGPLMLMKNSKDDANPNKALNKHMKFDKPDANDFNEAFTSEKIDFIKGELDQNWLDKIQSE